MRPLPQRIASLSKRVTMRRKVDERLRVTQLIAEPRQSHAEGPQGSTQEIALRSYGRQADSVVATKNPAVETVSEQAPFFQVSMTLCTGGLTCLVEAGKKVF